MECSPLCRCNLSLDTLVLSRRHANSFQFSVFLHDGCINDSVRQGHHCILSALNPPVGERCTRCCQSDLVCASHSIFKFGWVGSVYVEVHTDLEECGIPELQNSNSGPSAWRPLLDLDFHGRFFPLIFRAHVRSSQLKLDWNRMRSG
ncbi:hypothetical protein PM082_000262 [Marasmius tenuissimus]|nr:hypothetical protein PM082_000262 [Marasmius tenuissimus]